MKTTRLKNQIGNNVSADKIEEIKKLIKGQTYPFHDGSGADCEDDSMFGCGSCKTNRALYKALTLLDELEV